MNYKVVLKTIGPVHIGSGKKLNRQEYIFNKRTSETGYIDIPKFIHYLKSKGLFEKYLSYLDNTQSQSDLFTFLKTSNVSFYDHKRFIKMSIPTYTDLKEKYVKPPNDIMTFIRDGHSEVYIPGSSIKGILTNLLIDDFNKSNNTLSRFISISDSKPISVDNLAIYQKFDVGKKEKSLPLFRECIKPGTVIEFDIKLNELYVSLENLNEAIKNFQKKYHFNYISGFENTEEGSKALKRMNFTEIKEQEDVMRIYVGGGIGFASKTIHYHLLPKNEAKENVYKILSVGRIAGKVYRKFKTIPKNVPIVMKTTKDRNRQYFMGLCEISFEDKKEE